MKAKTGAEPLHTPKPRPRLSPTERRLQIIEAAAKLLSSEGFDSVTIAGVAEAA